jgi:hypothetical protein
VEGVARRGLGQDIVSLWDVPRTSWEDRVSIRIDPADHGRIWIEPYPFDVEPLVVSVPVRIVRRSDGGGKLH